MIFTLILAGSGGASSGAAPAAGKITKYRY